MSSRKLRAYRSCLRKLHEYKEMSKLVPEMIEESSVHKQDIANGLKMKYVTFWRKVSTNKLTMTEVEKIFELLIKEEESKN